MIRKHSALSHKKGYHSVKLKRNELPNLNVPVAGIKKKKHEMRRIWIRFETNLDKEVCDIPLAGQKQPCLFLDEITTCNAFRIITLMTDSIECISWYMIQCVFGIGIKIRCIFLRRSAICTFFSKKNIYTYLFLLFYLSVCWYHRYRTSSFCLWNEKTLFVASFQS